MSIAQDVCTTRVTYVVIPPGRMPHIRHIQLLLALATKLGDLPLFRFHEYAPLPLLLSPQPQLRTIRTCALCNGWCRTATYVAITAGNSKHKKLAYTKRWTENTSVVMDVRSVIEMYRGAETKAVSVEECGKRERRISRVTRRR